MRLVIHDRQHHTFPHANIHMDLCLGIKESPRLPEAKKVQHLFICRVDKVSGAIGESMTSQGSALAAVLWAL